MELILLTIASALVGLVFLLALAFLALRIGDTLEAIGNREPSSGTGHHPSDLARIRMGLRAIETETGHLTPEATQLNEGLAALAGALDALRQCVADARVNVERQKG